jgi:endogenous inhibitor of DNA gyrase (YacG/DUF329 family)
MMRKRDENGRFNKGKTFTRKCIFCGKQFSFTQTRRLKTSKFCSQKCHYLFGQTLETKRKISNSEKGERNPFYGRKHTRETRDKIKIARSKQIFSEESKIKILEALKQCWKNGKDHWNWKGGITPINQTIRHSLEYKLWRTAVFERDNYTCRFCGQKGGILEADHIKPFSLYPELRLAIDNGRTLCRDCHKTTDTYAGRVLRL